MAKVVSQITLGIDVSKDELVIYDWDTQQCVHLANQPEPIRGWLESLPGPVRLAIEPTSSYHLEVVEQAHRLGHPVYLINTRELAHYRQAVGLRHKTDPDDAYLLARYLEHEAAQLRRYTLRCHQSQQLWALLKRRAVIVQARKQLQQSLAETSISAKALFTQFKQLLARIDRRMMALLRALGWSADYDYCHSIPGIGPLNALALVSVFHRGTFASADAFIAFIGLDVRRRESGSFKGKRKLTKRGEAEIRRLLYCAAQPARTEPRFADYYQKQLDKGLSKTAAKVILARKLARIAFALISKQQMFVKSEKTYRYSP